MPVKLCDSCYYFGGANRCNVYNRLAPCPIDHSGCYNFKDRLQTEIEKNRETYWYGIYDCAYVCKNCECSMPMCADGDDVSRHFQYCPFCGKKIKAFYASEVDAEFLEDEKECPEVTNDAGETV